MRKIKVLQFFPRPSTLNPRSLPALLAWGLIALTFVYVPAKTTDAQTIYKYTDKNGVVVLTDKPPKGVNAEPVVTAKPSAPTPSGQEMSPAGSSPPPGSMTAEEVISPAGHQRDAEKFFPGRVLIPSDLDVIEIPFREDEA